MEYDVDKLNNYLKSLRKEERYIQLRKITRELKKDYFKVIVRQFHKKLKTALNEEINIIRVNDAINEGLNECGGGQGGLPYIPLPLYDIVGMCALCCSQNDILNTLNRFYGKYFLNNKIGLNTLRRRIIEECDSWLDLQRKFFKPVIEGIFYDYFGRIPYSDIYSKIYYAFSIPHTKEGYLYQWFRKGKKMDFDFWKNNGFLNREEIRKILENQVDHYCGFAIYDWEKWVIDAIPNKDIAKNTGLSFNTIVSIYKKDFGGRNEIKFEFIRNKIINLLEKRINLKNIYTFHLRKTFDPSNYKRDIMTWFRGMTPEEVENRWRKY